MRAAEKGRIPGRNRVEELISFAEKSGIKRIGIANCISLQREANDLKSRLEGKFEVYSVDCKFGKITGAELLGDETVKGLSCNPRRTSRVSGRKQYRTKHIIRTLCRTLHYVRYEQLKVALQFKLPPANQLTKSV